MSESKVERRLRRRDLHSVATDDALKLFLHKELTQIANEHSNSGRLKFKAKTLQGKRKYS